MIKNQDIICISSIDWDFIWQGHQEIMSVFAKNGNRVLFIENTGVRPPGIRDIKRLRQRIKNYFRGFKGIRKEAENLYVFSPVILPFPYSRVARFINKYLLLSVMRRWMNAMDFFSPVIWTFLPTGLALDIMENINHKLSVYYCIDSFSASSKSAKRIKSAEEKMLQYVDTVFVTSHALKDYCERYSRSVAFFPFGVNIEKFERAADSVCEIPVDLMNIKRPMVGYVGGIHKWLDLDLLKYLAEHYPEYSFVFVGPLQTDTQGLQGIKNLYFLGSKTHEELPAYIKNFSVTIIPYLICDYTNNVYPTKLNEYLAMGKAVVSTALPEVKMFDREYPGIVYIAENFEKFGERIKEAFAVHDPELVKRRIWTARENNWTNRIEQMSKILEGLIEKELARKESVWKETLRGLYLSLRRKTTRFLLTAGLLYILVFYSPLLWFFASPLKIIDRPEKADVILVFSGGVGESGQPGQGYEERVKKAVDLYNQGYSGHLVFSSGYTFVFKESEIMKALALSLGVPAQDIILDSSSSNNYLNVRNSLEIMKEHRWKSVLLVTSPYNTRRSAMVFAKNASGINVKCVPVENNEFYARGKKVTVTQIRGIIHEYLAIVYYFWKGWI